MKALTEMFIASFDLIEAEGRDLRRNTFRVGLSLAILLIAALLTLVGLLLLFWALFTALEMWVGAIGAALVVGVVVIAIAGGLVWMARRTVQ